MRVFLAGASGVIGRRLVPRLIRAGHAVTGMTRSSRGADEVRALGASPIICDALDEKRLSAALVAARPQVVINQLTAIPSRLNPRRIRADLAQTNRLRSEGTSSLVNAARGAGASRIISQSIGFAYRPGGSALATEDEPLYHDAPRAFRSLVSAVDACERATTSTAGIEGLVLRYGYIYGPGTIYAPDGTFAADVRHRRIPIVANGAGVFSFVHVDDAAAATMLAVETSALGVYNVVGHEPARLDEWLPYYASLLGAPRPFRVPALLGRLGAGPYGMYLMTQQRGASNRSAKESLGWRLQHASWRDGFRATLGEDRT